MLLLAAHAGNESIVRLLLKYGAAVDRTFSDAAKATHYAALSLATLGGTKSAVPLLINISEYGNSTLEYPGFANDSESKRRILRELRVEANRLTGKEGETPLMRAAKRMDVPAVRSLLKLGVNVKTMSRFGETALVLLIRRAASSSSFLWRIESAITIMGFLVDAGASSTEANRSGKKVLDFAEQLRNDSVLRREKSRNYKFFMSTVHFEKLRSSI